MARKRRSVAELYCASHIFVPPRCSKLASNNAKNTVNDSGTTRTQTETSGTLLDYPVNV